jgi:hypothetical protein
LNTPAAVADVAVITASTAAAAKVQVLEMSTAFGLVIAYVAVAVSPAAARVPVVEMTRFAVIAVPAGIGAVEAPVFVAFVTAAVIVAAVV